MRYVSGTEAAGTTLQHLSLSFSLNLSVCTWTAPSRQPDSALATFLAVSHTFRSTTSKQRGDARSIVGDERFRVPDRDASNAAHTLRQQPQYAGHTV